jgi:hypothetical protein
MSTVPTSVLAPCLRTLKDRAEWLDPLVNKERVPHRILGRSSSPYSPECVEDEFSEVR